MLEARMAAVRRHRGSNYIARETVRSEAAERKTAVVKILREELQAMQEHPYHWQPYRIDDAQLLKWATRLNTHDLELSDLTIAIDGICPGDIENWTKRSIEMDTELKALIENIYLRLDELNW